MHNDLAGIESRLVRDALARVLGRAGEGEGLWPVEGGGFALFARLVRVDLLHEEQAVRMMGALTRLKGSVGGLRRGGSLWLLRWLWRTVSPCLLRLRGVSWAYYDGWEWL